MTRTRQPTCPLRRLVWAAAAAALAGPAAGGCSTVVTCRRVPPGERAAVPGLQYALPKVLIYAVPKGDGSADVDVQLVPDPDNRYAIQTTSYFSTHAVEVQRENGMLQRFASASDAAAVTAAAVKASGEFTKSVLDARTAAAAADRASLNTAAGDVQAAEEAVNVAQRKLDTLRGNPDATKAAVLQAELDLVEKQEKLKTAKAKLDAARRADTPASPAATTVDAGAASAVGRGDAPAAPAGTATLVDKSFTIAGGERAKAVFGPVVYELLEREVPAAGDAPATPRGRRAKTEPPAGRPTVVLRAVKTLVNGSDPAGADHQRSFPTTAPTPKPTDKPEQAHFPSDVATVVPDEQGRAVITYKLAVPVGRLGTVTVAPATDPPAAPQPGLPSPKATASLDSATALRVDLTGLDPGVYDLVVPFLKADGTPQTSFPRIRVRVAPAPPPKPPKPKE